MTKRRVQVVVTCMGAEERDTLDRAMAGWKEERAKLRGLRPEPTEEEERAVYGFAYWLFRYSGLVRPV